MTNSDDVADQSLVGMVSEIAQKAVEAYQRSPVLRMLVALDPHLAVAEAGILAMYASFQHQRLQVFADEFTTLGLTVSQEDAKSKEFFDAYTSTAQHVLSESRDAKIRLFARLFGEFIKGGCTTPIDRYEEFLLMLDEISEREFKLLLLLGRYEANNPMQQDENRLMRAVRFWANFAIEAQEEFGVAEGNVDAMLGRLARTGMYQEFTGNYADYTGGRGYLTSSFTEFLSALGVSLEFDATGPEK